MAQKREERERSVRGSDHDDLLLRVLSFWEKLRAHATRLTASESTELQEELVRLLAAHRAAAIAEAARRVRQVRRAYGPELDGVGRFVLTNLEEHLLRRAAGLTDDADDADDAEPAVAERASTTPH